MLIENKPIPDKWIHKKSFLKILKKALRSEDVKNIFVKNIDDNIQRGKYNDKLKENLPKLMDKYKNKSAYEIDSDLSTLIIPKRSNNKPFRQFRNINDEYNYIIKKQNIKKESPRPDSIKENLNNILEYRKKIASRFKYTKFCDVKSNVIKKSRSQIMNPIDNSNFYTLSTNNDKKSVKKICNLKKCNNFNYKSNDNISIKEQIKKIYEDKFMITGMNNKNYKDNNTIEEENIKKEKNEIYRNNNLLKSHSIVY